MTSCTGGPFKDTQPCWLLVGLSHCHQWFWEGFINNFKKPLDTLSHWLDGNNWGILWALTKWRSCWSLLWWFGHSHSFLGINWYYWGILFHIFINLVHLIRKCTSGMVVGLTWRSSWFISWTYGMLMERRVTWRNSKITKSMLLRASITGWISWTWRNQVWVSLLRYSSKNLLHTQTKWMMWETIIWPYLRIRWSFLKKSLKDYCAFTEDLIAETEPTTVAAAMAWGKLLWVWRTGWNRR